VRLPASILANKKNV